VGQIAQISLTFDKEINTTDANSAANYELRAAGPDNIFGNSDDVIIAVHPSYLPGSKTVALIFDAPLATGHYRLTVFGNRSVHDLSGNQIDGDANGQVGGDYVRIFTVDADAPVVLETTVNDGQTQRSRLFDVNLTFNTTVQSSVQASDFVLKNVQTGQTINPQTFTLTFAANNQLRLGLQNSNLTAGDYQLTIAGAGIQNAAGTKMQQDYTLVFHVLPGDVNGDHRANDLDLFRVWQVLLKPASQRDLAFDLNGDGQVTNADLDIIKNSYAPAGVAATLPGAIANRDAVQSTRLGPQGGSVRSTPPSDSSSTNETVTVNSSLPVPPAKPSLPEYGLPAVHAELPFATWFARTPSATANIHTGSDELLSASSDIALEPSLTPRLQ
jgi:hypothetical protein